MIYRNKMINIVYYLFDSPNKYYFLTLIKNAYIIFLKINKNNK